MKSPCEMVSNVVSCIKVGGLACKESSQSEQARWEDKQTGLDRSSTNSSNASGNIHPGGSDGEMMHANESVGSNSCHGEEAEGEDDDLEECESSGGQDLLAWEVSYACSYSKAI